MSSCPKSTTDYLCEDVSCLEIERGQKAAPVRCTVLCESTVKVFVEGLRPLCISCTPSDLDELVVGRLFTDGYIDSVDDIEELSVTHDGMKADVVLRRLPEMGRGNAVHVTSTEDRPHRRCHGRVSSLEVYGPRQWTADSVFALCDTFSKDSPIHAHTSGTHSCRLFVDGELAYLAEDVGRHNALDKAIGHLLLNRIDPARTAVFSSGRIPIDMAIKAIRAKIPLFATKAAPTQQAIQIARHYGLVLVCLGKNGRLQVFSGEEALVS